MVPGVPPERTRPGRPRTRGSGGGPISLMPAPGPARSQHMTRQAPLTLSLGPERPVHSDTLEAREKVVAAVRGHSPTACRNLRPVLVPAPPAAGEGGVDVWLSGLLVGRLGDTDAAEMSTVVTEIHRESGGAVCAGELRGAQAGSDVFMVLHVGPHPTTPRGSGVSVPGAVPILRDARWFSEKLAKIRSRASAASCWSPSGGQSGTSTRAQRSGPSAHTGDVQFVHTAPDPERRVPTRAAD